MKNVCWYVAAAGVMSALAAVPASAQSAPRPCGERNRPVIGAPLKVVGLTSDQRLICFNERRPENFSLIGYVSGLVDDSRLIGIDYRPSTGDLYGLGNAGGVYTLDSATAVATFKTRLTVALDGSDFGVDFNPVVDRLRIVSSTGQNLRANVDTGETLVDATVSYTTPAAPAAGITAVAYTNNDSDTNTATTLFVVDTSLDQVAIQSPANAGTLVATGKLTVGTGLVAGFDIYSTVKNGVTTKVEGYAVLDTGFQSLFIKVNLLTGKGSVRGWFEVADQVTDIAIPLAQN